MAPLSTTPPAHHRLKIPLKTYSSKIPKLPSVQSSWPLFQWATVRRLAASSVYSYSHNRIWNGKLREIFSSFHTGQWVQVKSELGKTSVVQKIMHAIWQCFVHSVLKVYSFQHFYNPLQQNVHGYISYFYIWTCNKLHTLQPLVNREWVSCKICRHDIFICSS